MMFIMIMKMMKIRIMMDIYYYVDDEDDAYDGYEVDGDYYVDEDYVDEDDDVYYG